MALLALLRRQSGRRLARLAVLSGMAGLGNALVMAVASDSTAADQADLSRLVLFVLAVLIYLVAQRAVVRGSAREIEQIIHNLRMQLLDRILAARVPVLGRLQPADVYAAVTRDSLAISQAGTVLTLASQAALLLLFTLLYLLWISKLEFVVVVVSGVAFAALTIWRAQRGHIALDLAARQERELLSDMLDVIEGFKETKTSPRRARAQSNAITSGSGATATAKAAVEGRAAAGAVMTQAGLYLVLALLVFGLPEVAPTDPTTQRQTVTALLFAAGSIGLLVQGIPVLAAADEAAANLAHLAAELSPEQAGHEPLPEGPPVVELREAGYSWRNSTGKLQFEVGPLNLRLGAGEVVFITGGNGSGKSTLLHMAAGLLPLEQGVLLCNGEDVTEANLQSYRDRVGSILSGNHLFRRLYGEEFPPAQISALLEEFGLGGKVALQPDGDWNGLVALSGGQRKRLAMVALLLEMPSIIVLDEWAADQDPAFRRRFYEEILPSFRACGCAVLCATHDDRFFTTADRHYRLRDGQLELVALGGVAGPSEDPV